MILLILSYQANQDLLAKKKKKEKEKNETSRASTQSERRKSEIAIVMPNKKYF